MLVNEYGFDKSDPLFPKIATNPFQLNIFERIVKAQPISVCTANQIFNGACVANGLAPLSIHSVRRTRARHIENITHDDRIVALQCFFESTDFEYAIRNAISIGGDSDTIAAITGSVAEAYYGIPPELIDQAKTYIPDDLLEIVMRVENL